MTTSERIICEALTLPATDRLEVIEQRWDSLASAPEALQLTDVRRREIDRRIKDMDANPDAGIPWKSVMRERRSPQ